MLRLVGRVSRTSAAMVANARFQSSWQKNIVDEQSKTGADDNGCKDGVAEETEVVDDHRRSSTVFSSAIRFKVPDSKVTPETLPTADELEKMIPSLKDLERQIPSAAAMEKKYVFPHANKASQAAAAEREMESGENKPLWPNCDTPEEIMEEERYGADGEVRPAPSSQQVALAWKALGWGTLYAVLGCSVMGLVGLYVSGFRTPSQLVEHLRTREEREREKLRKTAEASGEEVKHFVVDLTNPLDLPRQIEEIYAAIQEIAEMEVAKEKATDAAFAISMKR